MDLLTVLLIIIGAGGVFFLASFVIDVVKHKDDLGKESPVVGFLIGLVTDFFDTLGIGSFAPTTLLFKVTKYLDTDKKIPGTLNVAHTIPVIMEAVLFLTGVKVEGITLFSMIAAAIAGALVGARIVNKLPEKKIQLVMGVCLIVTAFLMASGQLGWLKALGAGNEAVGLTGIKLIIGVAGNFILGALMMAGVGLYAPCMAMVYMLGLSPLVAFPIMMGSCAGLMAIGSPEFIKAGNYSRIGSIVITIGGVIGVTIAYTLVKSMPLAVLTWVIIGVVIITGISMIRQGTRKVA
ncbi:TSUP family transporter [uncultured Gemella sp.]|uniref:TSUP family transporter n=1 Tax=uncultured Gemella sp. TaxID=254352 RepID=UPI0028D75035|nr:TSUP family transporter [uncultured Gemella sp.]